MKKPPVRSKELVTGNVLQEVLDREDMAQWDLARRLGTTQGQLSRWIRGENRIPVLVQHIISCPACYPHYIDRVALHNSEG